MLPGFSSSGIIPPFQADATGQPRSPYAISLGDFVAEFSSSAKRVDLLRGFIAYRKALHSVGLTEGIQWVNGSFLEDCERIQGRSPNDIDVLTMFKTENTQHLEDVIRNLKNFGIPLFGNPALTKQHYNCDAYGMQILAEPVFVRSVAYWYSLFAHRRSTFEWKGFAEIDLAPQSEDAVLAGMPK